MKRGYKLDGLSGMPNLLCAASKRRGMEDPTVAFCTSAPVGAAFVTIQPSSEIARHCGPAKPLGQLQ